MTEIKMVMAMRVQKKALLRELTAMIRMMIPIRVSHKMKKILRFV